MIIAMSIMWMVKVSIYEVIHMVPMGNGLVPESGPCLCVESWDLHACPEVQEEGLLASTGRECSSTVFPTM